ncbi:MAG: UbiA family prenyltransferase [Candidatus ainarchaeum sp.]|nr:UbiA family prenyltransferase [Candidatus ainarchaeum sp.]
MRLKNCLMASIATIIGFFIATQFFDYNLIIVFFATFFICAGGQIINDYFDYDIDKKISKNKPLPSGIISKKIAITSSILFFVIGLTLAFLLNPISFFIACTFTLLLILYSGLFYKKKYLGNFIVAAGTAITFIFGASATNQIPQIIFFFFTIAFLANMAREITKDFEDLKKDFGFKKTLPMISKKLSKSLILFYYTTSIILAFVTGIIFSLNMYYYFFVIITTIIFIITIQFLLKNDFSKSQSYSKKGMIVSLIAFISAVFK